MDLDLGDDDGMIAVKIGDAEVTLDLWETSNKLYDFHNKNKTLTDREYNAGLVALVVELGFPPCSHRMAIRFSNGISAAVEAVKKKDSAPAASPGSTMSIPAA